MAANYTYCIVKLALPHTFKQDVPLSQIAVVLCEAVLAHDAGDNKMRGFGKRGSVSNVVV